ncbi:unnamed protein product [uncultured bacterium]|nr:unnamed protein product [uncultured bacterium]
MKVTKRTVDALQPRTCDALLWDDELRGFGVRCRPSGAKSYFLKYRTASGRQRWLTLGQHGPLTPQDARAMALREKATAAGGADPSGARMQKRREGTIAQIAARYLEEHVPAHNKPSTAAEVARIVEKRIKPALGQIKIGDLSRADIKAWHQRMSATPYEANRPGLLLEDARARRPRMAAPVGQSLHRHPAVSREAARAVLQRRRADADRLGAGAGRAR